MTSQEIYNTVRRHLLKQGRKANGPVACVYRTDDGLKCAVGVLIPDELYNSAMEGGSVGGLDHAASLVHEALFKIGIRPEQFGLLGDLQSLHDLTDPFFWKLALDKLAPKYNLEIQE